jgi:diacylglycerol kinase (ATP)
MSVIEKEKIIFIINPISGGRNKSGFQKMILKNLDLKQYEPILEYTQYPGHANEIAQKAVQENIQKIIAVGGDGTVNEVAKALIHQSACLGIVPFGSGNGLARHMGIPINPSKAVARLNNAQIQTNDAGVINEMPFFCTSGVGFDAHIGKIFATLKGRGFAGYVKAVLREFSTYKAQPYEVYADGKKITEEAFLITFANASQYGNNAYIAPQADVSDGKLDLCILKPFPLYATPDLALRVFNKTANRSSYMIASTVQELTIERAAEGPIHLDGEPFETGKTLRVSILPACLKVLV